MLQFGVWRVCHYFLLVVFYALVVGERDTEGENVVLPPMIYFLTKAHEW